MKENLVSEEQKRTGAFYTPLAWARKSHQFTSSHFTGWTQSSIWDCCYGKGDLVSELNSPHLFCSTLDEQDLVYTNEHGINEGAFKFKYDFLNDHYINFPMPIKEVFSYNKPIIFYINPPYGTSADMGEGHKSKIAKTGMAEWMKERDYGASTQQLYTQFLARIIHTKEEYNLTNVRIALFAPSLFLSGSSFKKFRQHFFKHFRYVDGFTFQASEFDNLVDDWGISFMLFESIPSGTESSVPSEFLISVAMRNKETDEITELEEKRIIYNLDKSQSASDWVKVPLKGLPKTDPPQLKNAFQIMPNEKSWKASSVEGAMGYLFNGGNNIGKNDTMVSLWSSPFYNGHGIPITKDNLKRAVTLFTARRSIMPDWMNWSDEYAMPNEFIMHNRVFVMDCLIYSLFNNRSYQSSLRNIEYKGFSHNIYNEWFWMKKEIIMRLAEINNFKEMINDINADKRSGSTLYTEFDNTGMFPFRYLSPESLNVITTIMILIVNSFPYREEFHIKNPQYQMHCWDAGYAQLKKMWKSTAELKGDFKNFKETYKVLENKLKPMIAEAGFLRNKY